MATAAAQPGWTACEDPHCDFCVLGRRLIGTLDEVDTDTGTELLTLVRVLAVTAVGAAARPTDLATLVDTIVRQLRADVAEVAPLALAAVGKEVQ
jgi:hypothetical protein